MAANLGYIRIMFEFVLTKVLLILLFLHEDINFKMGFLFGRLYSLKNKDGVRFYGKET